jgi:hypothetical protein
VATCHRILYVGTALVAVSCNAFVDLSTLRGEGGASSSSAGTGGAVASSSSTGAGATGGGDCNGADLTQDDENCGVCNHSCLGGACIASHCAPVILAGSLMTPVGVAVDAQAVYWTEHEGNRVMALTHGEADPKPVVEGELGPMHLTVHEGYLYWVTDSDQSTTGTMGEVVRYDLTVAQRQTLYTGVDLTGVAAGGGYVYWSERGGTVRRGPRDGTQPAVTLISTNLLGPEDIELVGRELFIADEYASLIHRFDLTNMNLTQYAGNVPDPVALAIDGTTVFVSDQRTGRVLMGDTSGGASLEPIASDPSGPTGIAVDVTAVYWASVDSGNLYRLAR